MQPLRTILAGVALTVAAGTTQAAPISFDFTKGPGDLVQKPNNTFLNLGVNSANFIDNSNTFQITAKAYYIPDIGPNAGTFQNTAATLYQQRSAALGSGLGICNNIENVLGPALCPILNGGAIDNQPTGSIEAEVLVLDLGLHAQWSLQNIVLGAFNSDDAYEVHARSYVAGGCATNFNLPSATPDVTATGGSSTINLAAFPSANCLYITGNFAGDNDDFFVTTLNAVTVAVPEPGTLALFGLGFAGFAFTRRRKTAA